MTKRIVAIVISLIAIYLVMGSVALAGNPHADFSANPDSCAACHRVHTATSGNLIKDPSGTAMCQTCHRSGAGADTDVMNGRYIAGGDPTHELWGDPNMNLLAGGFDFIKSSATDTTSKHIMDTPLVPYGAEPSQSGGATVVLKCLSCHTPHQDKGHPDQYRLLRVRPNGATSDKHVTWNGPWTDETQQTYQANGYRAYTEKDFDPERPDVQRYTNNYERGQDQWCAACHTRYTTRQDTSTYDAGDIFGNVMRYRHNTDSMITGVVDPVNNLHYDLTTDLPLNHPTANPSEDTMSCLTCHRVHGTDAVMSDQAKMINDGRGLLPVGSTLLKRSQRGVCTNCHANI